MADDHVRGLHRAVKAVVEPYGFTVTSVSLMYGSESDGEMIIAVALDVDDDDDETP